MLSQRRDVEELSIRERLRVRSSQIDAVRSAIGHGRISKRSVATRFDRWQIRFYSFPAYSTRRPDNGRTARTESTAIAQLDARYKKWCVASAIRRRSNGCMNAAWATRLGDLNTGAV